MVSLRSVCILMYPEVTDRKLTTLLPIRVLGWFLVSPLGAMMNLYPVGCKPPQHKNLAGWPATPWWAFNKLHQNLRWSRGGPWRCQFFARGKLQDICNMGGTGFNSLDEGAGAWAAPCWAAERYWKYHVKRPSFYPKFTGSILESCSMYFLWWFSTLWFCEFVVLWCVNIISSTCSCPLVGWR